MNYTVTHYGIQATFSSIWQAMRYSRKLWRQNVRTIIWSPERPIFDSAEFKRKKQLEW
jgi:hypothetical protein